MLQKHNIQLSEYQAQYYETGDGFPLIFLHGFLGNGSHWGTLIEKLSPHYRCIAPDLLGFGGSSKPSLQYNIWHQVDFLQEFLEALGIRQYAMLGHSFGGWTTAAFAVQANPEQLKHVALLAPAGIRDDEFIGRYNHLRPLLWPTPVVDWVLKGLSLAASLFAKQDAIKQIIKIRQKLLEQPVAASLLRDRLKPEDAIDTVEQDLHQIQVPSTIFAGQLDTTIPLWHCETYAQGIENSELYVYEDAEHDLLHTHAPLIADTLLQVLPS